MNTRNFPFEIRVCPLLTCGGIGHGPNGIFILLSDQSSPEDAAETIWHEIVHLLKSVGGHDQNEDEVELAAKKLAATCPEVVAWTGLKFPLRAEVKA